MQGATGLAGLQGIQGGRGPIGPVGPQGMTGPQGIQGIQGIDGRVSSTGPAGATGDLSTFTNNSAGFVLTASGSGTLAGQSNVTFDGTTLTIGTNMIVSPTAPLTTTVDPSVALFTIASSADGTRLAATQTGGFIYTSADSGATWTKQTGSGSRTWTSIASSADGTRLAAGVRNFGGFVYTSADSGVTWTEQTGSGSRTWTSIACSADGTRLAATQTGGFIYTSADSGVTWTEQTGSGSRNWQGIASSADGTRLAAVAGDTTGLVYTSTDSGATWVQQSISVNHTLSRIASSADGTRLVVTGAGFGIHTSTDSGVTWVRQGEAGARTWSAIASSADGMRLAASEDGGFIYTSGDSGVTWTALTVLGSRNWQGIASSADGNLLAGVARTTIAYILSFVGGNLYIGNNTSANPAYSFINNITTGMYAPVANNLAFSVGGTERIRILSNGNVGIGLSNPTFQLQLSTDSAAKPTSSSWSVTSDQRIKRNIVDADLQLCYDTVKSLKLKRFEWDPSWNATLPDRHSLGFIAQEVKQYFPKSVKLIETEQYPDFHTLDVDQLYNTMYGAIVNAITRKERLEKDIAELENHLSNK